ncbi:MULTISPECIES: hypothetical protein [unclassified Lactococcus]|uniref:hypothetical protein n=1 Tax=unclassified Lactococcus TaxID=2643510 RepID=UPI0011CC90C3|nr:MULTISPECIES: hypothetical protein [unclassified Lactococcus]MQW23727.1 hypothetical protein [Lactococcus sp. dk101]TXK37478.1 hypothetical protein FVP42_08930 [Lactococcus sp. dk310]TXK48821.1 hypothetical protein FVP43_08905 [Lactococcus sp. dk322]
MNYVPKYSRERQKKRRNDNIRKGLDVDQTTVNYFFDLIEGETKNIKRNRNSPEMTMAITELYRTIREYQFGLF